MEKSFSLQELIDLDELQSIQDGFAKATGMSSIIFSPEGEPLTRFTNPTSFCSLIQSTGKGKECCFRSFVEMSEKALRSEKPQIFYCFAHGGHFVEPILIDGEYKGTMFAGQFRCKKLSSDQLTDLRKRAVEIGLDPELLAGEAEKMRVLEEGAARNCSNLLFQIVKVIASHGVATARLARANEKLKDENAGRKAVGAALVNSELRFRDIAESMSDWIWETGADGTYTYCSEKTKDVLGYSAEEMIGKTPFGFMSADEEERIGPDFARIVKQKRPIKDMENWIRAKDGRSVCMLTSAVPIFDDKGELTGYRGVDSDITKRKVAEEKLKKTAGLLQSIMNSATEMIIVATDPKGTILSWNEGARRLLGYEPEEVTGKENIRIFHAEEYQDSRRIESAIKEMIASRKPVTAEINYTAKDGRTFPVQQFVNPRFNEYGVCIGMLGLAYDITERRQTEEELAMTGKLMQQAVEESHQLALQAQSANEAKSEFLANMSHEIRTPMNGVIGMTGLLLDTELTPEQREYAETAEKSANALLRVINDILDFSKIGAGKIEMETLDFDLRLTIEDMTDMLAIRGQEKGLEMACLIEPEVPSLLRGDPGRLRQILTNLIGNSVKFTAQGEVALVVSLDHEDDTEAVIRFAVKDTGIGIPADKLNILFDSFTQVDASMTRKFGGTGLGLTISKQLSEMMGGEIGVESKEGKGSTFWFTARLRKQQWPGRKEGIWVPDLSLKGIHVLCVDHNATNRRAIGNMLSMWECRHEDLSDAGTAMVRLRAAAASGDPFRIAILDMQMPEADGETLGKMIKDDPALADTVLVMMTWIGTRGDARRLEKAGFAVYLTKPVKQSRVYDCLVMAVGRKLSVQSSPEEIITRHTVAQERKKKIRILLAEDNMVNQKVALKILEKMGYHADPVANGAEAVNAVETIPYDMVLMDIQMPEMDGLEATKEIRKRESQPTHHPPLTTRPSHIPIIAMTAHAMKGDEEICLNAGMDDYLTKPIQPDKLADAIARWSPDSADAAKDQTGKKPCEEDGTDGKPCEEALAFDRTALLDRLGGDEEIFQEIIGIFMDDVPEQIKSIEDAVTKADPALIQRQAHTLKGASANVGAVALQKAALDMEMAGKSGDMGKALEMLDVIKEKFERVKGVVIGDW